jgi:hypothetical protein
VSSSLDGGASADQARAVALADLVERMSREADQASIARAREAFHAATGPFEGGERWYEERINAFFDFALASFEDGALARAFARRADLTDDEQRAAIALTRAERSVFVVEAGAGGLVCTGLFGARYRVAATGVAARFSGGERFDGRIVSLDGVLQLMPGAVFHPPEAENAIAHLLADVQAKGIPPAVRSQAELADALLRMRMRLDRFTSIHPRHVYRYDAIERTEILAASWARPEGRAAR